VLTAEGSISGGAVVDVDEAAVVLELDAVSASFPPSEIR
jgi:hypothetical protein